MITLLGQSRRFSLLNAPGGKLRFLGVIAFGVILVALGAFLYDNALTVGIFGTCMTIIIIWLLQNPKPITVKIDSSTLTVQDRSFQVSTIDSWSIVDLQDTAELLIKLKNNSTIIEIYSTNEAMTDSGIINFLTEQVPFNPDITSTNTVTMMLRALNLY